MFFNYHSFREAVVDSKYLAGRSTGVEYIADSRRNPFDLRPPCEQFVPGYGDVNADFHVVGGDPTIHGGLESGIPFTGQPWSEQFFQALEQGGLTGAFENGELDCPETFFSYLCQCNPGEIEGGIDAAYERLEPYFDAECRAITAHVLIPVGERAIRHVLRTYSSMPLEDSTDTDTLHAQLRHGAGWLILPVSEPADWAGVDASRLAEAIRNLRASDYRQHSDLGRFHPDEEPYFVR